MWKVGILGAGYIAVHHVNALKLMPNVEIVAICDRNVHQAQSLKKLIKNDASIYSTLDEMLQQKNLDVVHVLLPPDLHFMTAEQTLRAGKHVFIEKPMCIDVKDCQSLCELAQSKNRQIGVNQNFLYYEIYKKLKQCLSDGEIGPLDHLMGFTDCHFIQIQGTRGIRVAAEDKNIFFKIYLRKANPASRFDCMGFKSICQRDP